MITFKHLGGKGRMGNQLFQLASTISHALDNNDQYVFPPWKYEQYFNLHDCFSNNFKPASEYEEPYFHYKPIPYKKDMNINGYFQSYKYFRNHEEFIKKLFTPVWDAPVQLANTAIHVRRTDYINFSDYHNLVGMDYYHEAMRICPSEKYCIFSDDINWCKNNFKGSQFIFAEGNSEVEDLAMMIKCGNVITAASSFSWWGAYLNNNPGKKVIAPARWFGQKTNHNTADLCPLEWERI